jgi:hypothetical protein
MVDRNPMARTQIRAGQTSTLRYARTASDIDVTGYGSARPASQLAVARHGTSAANPAAAR